jgi:hypothetical protein
MVEEMAWRRRKALSLAERKFYHVVSRQLAHAAVETTTTVARAQEIKPGVTAPWSRFEVSRAGELTIVLSFNVPAKLRYAIRQCSRRFRSERENIDNRHVHGSIT